MITILHPSRSRPQQAFATAKKWIDRIGLGWNDFEYVLSLDEDDPLLWKYNEKIPCLNRARFINKNRSAVDAINVAASFYSKHRGKPGDFLIVISDDFDCPENWGPKVIGAMFIDDCLLKTFDGIQKWVVTLPIMGWDYYRRFGYVYHSDYTHCFCDTELTCVAELLHRLIYCTLEFKHNHYSIGGNVKDELYERNDATFESGKKIFIERKARNFDLKPEEIKGQMSNNIYSRM